MPMPSGVSCLRGYPKMLFLVTEATFNYNTHPSNVPSQLIVAPNARGNIQTTFRPWRSNVALVSRYVGNVPVGIIYRRRFRILGSDRQTVVQRGPDSP
jgi:hypothetical protein